MLFPLPLLGHLGIAVFCEGASLCCRRSELLGSSCSFSWSCESVAMAMCDLLGARSEINGNSCGRCFCFDDPGNRGRCPWIRIVRPAQVFAECRRTSECEVTDQRGVGWCTLTAPKNNLIVWSLRYRSCPQATCVVGSGLLLPAGGVQVIFWEGLKCGDAVPADLPKVSRLHQ